LARADWSHINREAARLTDEVYAELGDGLILGGIDFGAVIWHVHYWYGLRLALSALRLFEGLLEGGGFTAASVYGCAPGLGDVLARCARKRGVAVRIAGLHEESHRRRRRLLRHASRLPLPLPEVWARRLRGWGTLLDGALRRRRRADIDVLVLPVVPGDRANWLPVAAALPTELCWGVADWGTEKLAAYPAPRFDLRAWLEPRRLRRWWRRFDELSPLLDELPARLKSLSWRGVELKGLNTEQVLRYCRMLVWRLLGRAAALEALLEALRPRLLVGLSERGTLVQTAFQAARRLGVAGLALESHDMVYDEPLFGRLDADRLAVCGRASAEIYRRHGVPAERIVVTGQPAYDRLAVLGAEGHSSEREYLPPGKERLVVFFSQPSEVTFSRRRKLELLRAAAGLQRSSAATAVLVKPHPREDPQELEGLIKQAGLPQEAILPFRLDLYKLLIESDVVVTAFSTVGVEALVLGKPVAVLRVPGEEAVLEYTASEGVYRAFNAEELAEGVQRLLRDPELRRKLAAGRRAYLERHEAGADGGAARRVAAVIGELLQGE
jgi:glycosyltransferase involved in cell wall biosynthesis